MAAVTARYARALADVVFEQKLDAQKNEEMLLPVKPEGKPRDTSRPLKDW